MVKGTLDHFGPIDVLMDNAGTIQRAPFEMTTTGDFEAAMQTHFSAPLFTTLAVLPGEKAGQQEIRSYTGRASGSALVQ
jgi:NAD(P)-dependent dehydrogenase (short-subunit alcohol dehydrogenase family)